jgi:hypothetical protein
MIDVPRILELQTECTASWHHAPIENTFDGLLGLVCQQHQFNYQLWHQEDIARSPDVSDTQIAQVKRAIDRLNQLRNDWIERIDDWITRYLEENRIEPVEGSRQNSETPGSMIDRLSIIALRIYHLEEQLDRTDVDESHIEKVQHRIAVCKVQQAELGQCLAELWLAITSGSMRHRTYRQFKMYNDPSMNPYLYQRQVLKAS